MFSIQANRCYLPLREVLSLRFDWLISSWWLARVVALLPCSNWELSFLIFFDLAFALRAQSPHAKS